jgi:microcystin-dependent protein
LCNGSNSTPDLRDRFVVGAGSTYAVNATGGANTVTLDATMIPAHTHTVSASGTTGNQSADHSHTFSGTSSGQSNNHTHTISDPGHFHAANSGQPGLGEGAGGGNTVQQNAGSEDTSTNTTGITGTGFVSNDHSHTYSGTTSGMSGNHNHTVTVSGTTGNGTGGGLAHENRPPYFALAYIMKT